MLGTLWTCKCLATSISWAIGSSRYTNCKGYAAAPHHWAGEQHSPQGLPHHLPPSPFVSSGCKNTQHGQMLKELMQTPNFRVTVVQEADTVEICGALKVGEPLTGVCRSWLAKPAVL